jgi:toxin ParE1/3/4
VPRSSRKARIIITSTAREDIGDILQFTEEERGPAQREAYSRQIEAAIDRLSLMPSMGRSQDDVYPGIRSTRVGSHISY